MKMRRMTLRRFQRKRSEVSVQKLPEMLWRRRIMLLCQGQPERKLSLWRRETSKEAGGAEKAVADKVVSMEPESSKEAGTAARATEGFNSPVKTETVAVSDIEVSSEKSSKNGRPVRKKRSYLRLGKVAGVAGVCLLCVFAASMTSEANRNHFIRRNSDIWLVMTQEW